MGERPPPATRAPASESRPGLSRAPGREDCGPEERAGRGSFAPAKPLSKDRSLRGQKLVGADLSAANLSGVDLTGTDLSGADLSRADLSGADLSGADLSGADLSGARMGEAALRGAQLTAAELLGADLTGADLTNVSAAQAGFGHAVLRQARLFGADLHHATLSEADLQGCDLRRANLEQARLRGARLVRANLERANLQHADAQAADIAGARLRETDLRGARLRGVAGFASADFVGADVRDVDFAGAYLVRRHVLDQNYLYEFRRQSRLHRVLYGLWWATSDCGRSLWRWGSLTAAITVAFGLAYEASAVSYAEPRTLLSPYYFSLVTLTTLGYGDVLPTSTASQGLVMLEVVLGHLLFGGLLSILSTKLARRAE